MKKKLTLLFVSSLLLLASCGGGSKGKSSNCGLTCPVGIQENTATQVVNEK